MKPNLNKTAYPTLPLDTERIRTYRRRCQKPREQEEIWTWYVLRRLSIYVTLLLMRTTVTPNAVTWLGFLFFMLTGWLIVLGEPLTILLAVVSYNIGYMCDCIDGELARLKNSISRRGYFIDTLIRASSIPIITAVAIVLLSRSGALVLSGLGATVLYVGIVLATLALLVPLAYNLTFSEREESDPVGDMRLQSRRMDWLAFFLGLPGLFAILPIGVLVETVFSVPFITLVFAIFLGLFSLKTLARLYMTYKSIH